ncbi:hypothetical protein M2277_005121 [Paenibacillus sp. LBL]|uniref:hypothetical protein n=1 Tax=Paenibacillus sp. LBL TaxID=2940563 RepID=UPI0024737010|nr:hypothetical protein [Paenibacillus sp. LBL]MDH6674429.1 hypothetical protein [Paenibacillus sp. LBL]
MATSYQELYPIFLSKVSDYSFMNMQQDDLEKYMEGLLSSAVPKFRFCKAVQGRDAVAKAFNEDLKDIEKEILVSLMLVEYMKPKILTSEILKQNMSDKDFKIYSQANHLKELSDFYNKLKSEADKMITEYSFVYGDLGELK